MSRPTMPMCARPIMNVATDVPGTVAEVAVRENQHVEKGAILFVLDAEPFQYRARRRPGAARHGAQ